MNDSNGSEANRGIPLPQTPQADPASETAAMPPPSFGSEADAAGDKAEEAGAKAREAAGKAEQAFGDAKAKASEYMHGAGDRAKDIAAQTKGKASEALSGLSRIIAENAETVDRNLGAKYGDYARQASDSVAGAARRLDEKGVDELTEDAREFVRKSPAMAIGIAAVAGFALARLFRGSSHS